MSVVIVRKVEQDRTEQNRTEQNRTEQNRTEQNRTEQNISIIPSFFSVISIIAPLAFIYQYCVRSRYRLDIDFNIVYFVIVIVFIANDNASM